jgi:hypothetical protein
MHFTILACLKFYDWWKYAFLYRCTKKFLLSNSKLNLPSSKIHIVFLSLLCFNAIRIISIFLRIYVKFDQDFTLLRINLARLSYSSRLTFRNIAKMSTIMMISTGNTWTDSSGWASSQAERSICSGSPGDQSIQLSPRNSA